MDAFVALSKVFSAYGELDRSACLPLLQHLQRVFVIEGTVLWQQGDTPDDGLYVVESGVLRAVYKFADRSDLLEESMVGGTLAGELSALANLPRNATVSVEKDAVLWRLSVDSLDRLQVEHPELARTFVHLVLKGEFFVQFECIHRLKIVLCSCERRLRHSTFRFGGKAIVFIQKYTRVIRRS